MMVLSTMISLTMRILLLRKCDAASLLLRDVLLGYISSLSRSGFRERNSERERERARGGKGVLRCVVRRYHEGFGQSGEHDTYAGLPLFYSSLGFHITKYHPLLTCFTLPYDPIPFFLSFCFPFVFFNFFSPIITSFKPCFTVFLIKFNNMYIY